jgi:hypothetical protein
MKQRYLLASLLAVSLSGSALAQNEAKFALPSNGSPGPHSAVEGGAVIDEDFADITTLAGAGWSLQNLSNPIGTTDWFQGNDATFPSQAGAPTAYIGANFNNTTGGAGLISNWLLTPEVNFGTGAELRFWTRVPTGGSQFPDRLEVRVSAAGASTDVGADNTTVGDFTTTLTVINPNLDATAGVCPPGTGGYPEDWCEIVITNAEGLPTTGTGRVGFRYFVDEAGPTGNNSNFIGIDTVSFLEGTQGPSLPPPSEIPTLGQYGMIAMFLALLAGAGLTLRRRQSS